jgi:hypothetical protein
MTDPNGSTPKPPGTGTNAGAPSGPEAGASSPEAGASSPAAPTRKPYHPPRILSREPIEGRANVCDPLAGGKHTAPSCNILKS